MIKFVNKNGELYFGQSPYVHWFGDNLYEQTVDKNYDWTTPISGQSTNLQYTKNIILVSTSDYLTFEIKDSTSIFKLVDVDIIDNIVNNVPKTQTPLTYYNYPDALVTKLSNVEGVSTEETTGSTEIIYAYQLIVAASTPDPGQYTENIVITDEITTGESITITVGADFYDYDEIMSINLGNRGTEIPETIQKALYRTDINEAYVDNILINRKFKELISNYLDIMDNRGSYKSLWNSLEWFEWGDNVKLYEVWKNEEGYFEKELENILSEQYKSLLYTHQKTTYLSLVAALTKDKDSGELDDEKNPVVENISHLWSNDILGLKISLLGAFFERYFMPIHLALKRASVQTHVYTTAIKVKYNSKVDIHSWHDDWGVIDINMDHTVALGNVDPVSVGRDTVFGYQDVDSTDDYYVHKLAGVDYLKDVTLCDSTDNEEVMTIWGNIRGHVGVVVPVTVTVPLPKDDALNAESIVIYRYPLNGKPSDDANPVRVLERRLWKPVRDGNSNRWFARFSFNLLSTTEEKVSFTLQLYSLSGHTWTAAASYESLDTSGATLEACRVGNKIFTGIFEGTDPWATWNPYSGMFNTINATPYTPVNGELDPSKYQGNILKQYVPCGDQKKFLNELVIFLDPDFEEIESELSDEYYIFEKHVTEGEPVNYAMCIRKKGGVREDDEEDPIDSINENIYRRDYIFVPQLHTYTPIESIRLKVKDMKYIMSYDDYLVDPDEDLILLRAQYKYSKKIDPSSISWLFENKTTHERIELNGGTPQQQPLVANKNWKGLSEGYWSVTMTFRFLDSPNSRNSISRNSLFLVQKRKDD